MKAKKKFLVVAYDIANNKRRRKVVKILSSFGAERVNLSVMELLIPESKISGMKSSLREVISKAEDTIIFYPLDLNCFAQIEYMKKTNKTSTRKTKVVTAV